MLDHWKPSGEVNIISVVDGGSVVLLYSALFYRSVAMRPLSVA